MGMLRKLLPIVTIAGLSALAARIAYPWVEPARWFYEEHGIDVSHHQGRIDWRAVAKDGVKFAFIKASEGGDFVDPRFAENWSGAGKAKIYRGAYHFFTQCRPGKVQAENFIRTVPNDKSLGFAAIDAEHMGPCRRGGQVKNVAKQLQIFLDRVHRHYGLRPFIYTTREFHDRYLKGKFSGEIFWIRSLVIPPRFRDKQWLIWQYHNRGRRAGIDGPVDLNVMRTGENFRNVMKYITKFKSHPPQK